MYKQFLELLRFEFLSPEGIEIAVQLLDVADISGALWQSLQRRLLLPVAPPKNPGRYAQRARRLAYREHKPFKGIMARLSKDAHGNAHVKKVVSITASSRGNNEPHQVIDYGWKGDWGTKNKENGWIKFDLINRKAELTGYSIMSIPSAKGYGQPKSWVLEASNDDDTWLVLDDHQKSQDLNGKSIIKYYTFGQTEPFRYVRLRQTGQNWAGNNYLSISQLELFGFLWDAE